MWLGGLCVGVALGVLLDQLMHRKLRAEVDGLLAELRHRKDCRICGPHPKSALLRSLDPTGYPSDTDEAKA